jgi:hypothetical protein
MVDKNYEIPEDERKLFTFSKTLGDYEVGFSLYSYADVLGIVTGDKKGVLLVDTCGHRKDYGQNMMAFVRRQIIDGWGVKGDVREELLNFGKRLADVNGPAERCEGDDWCDGASGLYVQLGDKVGFSSNGGMGKSIIFRKGDEEYLPLKGTYLDDIHQHKPEILPIYETELGLDDVLLLQSDGVDGNMIASIHYGHSNKSSKTDFIDVISSARKYSPLEIVDYANHTLKHVLDNIDLRYDDMSFIIIKKKK